MKFIENLNVFYKKIMSLGTAVVLMFTPVMGHAENNDENTNEQEFALVMQAKKEQPLGYDEYSNGVKNAYNYLKQFINYDNLLEDIECLYYLVNREYMPEEDENVLIGAGIVFETNLNEGKYENFMHAYNLINMIADYNQSVIRKTDKIEDLIDVSELCSDEADKNLVHDMHVNYFNAYKNGRFENADYQMVFKQLTTLNAYEQAGNASEISVGARWLAENSIGGGVMQLLRDDMQEDFTREELDKYFDRNELNQGQWIIRNDVSLDINCIKSELELEVLNFGQLWHFVYDTVNNDLFKTFEVDCTKTK